MIFWKPPCEGDRERGAERIAVLVDGEDDPRLASHVSTCARCEGVLTSLRAQRASLASLGDAPGAGPDEAGLHRVLAALTHERQSRRPGLVVGWSFATAAVVILGGIGVRQLLVARAGRAEDSAIVAGADAAFRRAEREYGDAVAMLRERLSAQRGGAIDASVEEGARTLAEARRKASELARARRADPERESLLRDALRAEVRFYEDALLRVEGGEHP